MTHIPYTKSKRKKRKTYISPVVMWESNGEDICQSRKVEKPSPAIINQKEPPTTPKSPTQSLREKMGNLLKES